MEQDKKKKQSAHRLLIEAHCINISRALSLYFVLLSHTTVTALFVLWVFYFNLMFYIMHNSTDYRIFTDRKHRKDEP